MQDRFRTSLASVALVASLSVAGVASAHGGSGEPGRGHGKAKPCKLRGKGYEVKGLYAGGDLTQVAGEDTPRWGDDRWSGTIVVDVQQGNHRGRRDVGLSSYPVTNVRVVGVKDGVIPDEGTRLQLIGKQTPACAPAPTTPTTPTAPTTSQSTTPEATTPTASRAAYADDDDDTSPDTPEAIDDDGTDAEDDAAPTEKPSAKAGKGKPAPRSDDDDDERGGASSDDRPSGDDSTDDSDGAPEATAVGDVTITVVQFKGRPAAARR